MKPSAIELSGVIASCGFSSGHRIVVGAWSDGPLGAMNDVMVVDPDNKRTLIAPNAAVAEFVSSIYHFESHIIVDAIDVDITAHGLKLHSPVLQMQLTAGRSIPVPFATLRTPFVTRWVEGPIARRLLKVQTYGVTSAGIREWYKARRYQRVTSASAQLNGIDLGDTAPLTPRLNVGFSEPPRQPSMVHVSPRLLDPSGALNEVVDQHFHTSDAASLRFDDPPSTSSED